MVRYPFGGWKSFFKAIGWAIAFLLIGASFSILFGIGNVLLLERSGVVGLRDGTNLAMLLLVQGVSPLAGFGLATWSIGRRVMGLRARTLDRTSGRAGRRRCLPGLLC